MRTTPSIRADSRQAPGSRAWLRIASRRSAPFRLARSRRQPGLSQLGVLQVLPRWLGAAQVEVPKLRALALRAIRVHPLPVELQDHLQLLQENPALLGVHGQRPLRSARSVLNFIGSTTSTPSPQVNRCQAISSSPPARKRTSRDPSGCPSIR